jgi:hypothetical protein
LLVKSSTPIGAPGPVRVTVPFVGRVIAYVAVGTPDTVKEAAACAGARADKVALPVATDRAPPGVRRIVLAAVPLAIVPKCMLISLVIVIGAIITAPAVFVAEACPNAFAPKARITTVIAKNPYTFFIFLFLF